MKMHWCEIVLRNHPIKNYHFAISYKKSGVTWRKTYLILIDSVKLFYNVVAYFFFSELNG
jgi:hypothetical protein